MRQVFTIGTARRVPDQTLVAPLLNAMDTTSGLTSPLLEGVSIAAGTVEARHASKIHLMPHVAQITFIRRGHLTVRMKGQEDAQPYFLSLSADQAVLSRPGTLLQLINEKDTVCEALYIVSPAYVFEMVNDRIVYDDAVVLDEDWDALERACWRINRPVPSAEQRRAALSRLAQKPIEARTP